ncbi:MAG: hypothetical protein IPM30_14905 [Burkholderiales bacterium]|nr:hypothetical protein [Burkholderiales bacterium]
MPYDDRLFVLLRELDDTELEAIWVTALRREISDKAFDTMPRHLRIDQISKEWRAIHGHTILNLWRGPHDLPWKRILIDVADKLKPGWGWTSFRIRDGSSEEQIERAILGYFDERAKAAWGAMKDSERAQMAQQLDAELSSAQTALTQSAGQAALGSVTMTSLGAGISAGLVTGAGALALAQGATSFAISGLMGGVLYQLGVWLIVRVFGIFTGAQLAVGGGAAAVGGALLSAPAAVAFAANALMTTSYRKTVPATLLLLTAHELRRQLAALEEPK